MIATLLALLALAQAPEIIDRIMAVIAGQPITLSQVAAATQFELVPVPEGTKDPTGYALDRLIDRSLMLVEVDRFQPPEPDQAEITVQVDRLQARAGSAEAFEKALAMTGTTRDDLRRYVRDALRIQIYINQRFGPILDPVEREESVAAWVRELRRRAQVIVLYRPPPPKS